MAVTMAEEEGLGLEGGNSFQVIEKQALLPSPFDQNRVFTSD